MSNIRPAASSATPRRVGVREFRGNLTAFLNEVRQGACFQITSRDVVLAELRPPAAADRPRRKLGGMKGKIWMAPDFDTLPDDVLDAFEGRDE